MRERLIALRLATFIVATGLATTSFAKSDEVTDVTKLPKAVRQTVREQVGGGKIVKIQKESADGKIAYGVACVNGGKKWQIEIAPDGKLLLRAEEIKLSELSTAVQKTVEQNAANGKIESVAKVTEGGQSYFEAAVTFNGQEKTFIIGADGKLIDTQIPENQARQSEIRGQEPEPTGGPKR